MRKIKNTIIASIFFAFMLFTGAEGHALEKITLATGEWEPMTSSKMEDNGFESEIVRKAFETQGIKIELQFYPWKRCERFVQAGKVDATFPYMKTDERSKLYDFSDAIASARTEFFYLKDKISNLSFEKYEDLKPYKIGGILGYFYEEIFKKAGLHVEYVTDLEQNIKKALSGRIDIFPMVNVAGWLLIKRQFPNEYERFGTFDFDLPSNKKTDEEIAGHIMTLKGNPKGKEIIAAYNRGIKKIKENGEYDKILIKYGLKSE